MKNYWLIVAFVIANIPFVFRPITGAHKWRQADTAAVIRNFAFESPAFFYPRIDFRRDKTGITGMEFPLYQFLAAIPMRLSGQDWDFWGKIVALLFAALGLLFASTFLAEQFGISAFWAQVALIASPQLVQAATMVMPETCAFCCVMMGNLFLLRFQRTGQQRFWWGAWIGLMIGVLVRPFQIVWCLPLAYYWGKKTWMQKSPLNWEGLLALLILLPFGGWYFFWNPYLIKTYGLSNFAVRPLFGENLHALYTSAIVPQSLIYFLKHYLGWIGLPFFLWGSYLKRRSVGWVWPLGIGVAWIFLLIISGRAYYQHFYYQFAFLPFVALVMALALTDLAHRWSSFARPLIILLLLSYPLTHPHQLSKRYFHDDLHTAMRRELAQRTHPEDLVVVENLGEFPYHLYALRRKGWVATREELADPQYVAQLQAQGAKWLIKKVDGQLALFPL